MFKNNKKLKVAMEIAFAVSAAGVATIIHNAPVSAAINADSTVAVGQARAQILQQITSASAGTLDFGKVLPTSTSGTVHINDSGTITDSGGARYITGSGAHVATLSFTGQPNQNIVIDAPASTVITNGTQTMTVTFDYPTLPTQIGTNGNSSMNYGGTLAVGANQAPGLYAGTYDIYVTYVA